MKNKEKWGVKRCSIPFSFWLIILMATAGCIGGSYFDLASLEDAARRRDTRFIEAHKSQINARINGRRPNTFTHAVIVAAEFGAYNLVEAALNYGADLSVTNSEGITPLMAMMIGDPEPNTNIVRRILDCSSGQVNSVDARGNTALHYAAQNRGTNTVLLLLAHRADVSVTNSEGKRPADLASSSEKRRLLE